MQHTLILALGKRLVNNQLTLEGKSRVSALVEWLAAKRFSNPVIGFCGGCTDGQSVSEASAMADAFIQQCLKRGLNPSEMTLVLEQDSTNTIENIECMAQALIEKCIFTTGSDIDVIFASNDYHLKRIFEIQSLMDEQGLLRVLKQRCAEHGLNLHIDSNLGHHILAPYPYCCDRAALFLLMDEITPYRVYLEGVVGGVFQRPLALVREVPFSLAENAISLAQTLCQQRGEGADVLTALFEIERTMLETTPDAPVDQVQHALRILHSHLTRLNRHFDPEQPFKV
ncbi:YdcF family protein [Vibrio fluvialis]|nr:YdcF family protein [Vibrio fluvialis]MBY8070181.1 YdcF family protein [Vibrio fluvialis]MBY8130055.1 YdcF family protein [Vibrio fluvialis]